MVHHPLPLHSGKSKKIWSYYGPLTSNGWETRSIRSYAHAQAVLGISLRYQTNYRETLQKNI